MIGQWQVKWSAATKGYYTVHPAIHETITAAVTATKFIRQLMPEEALTLKKNNQLVKGSSLTIYAILALSNLLQ